MPFDPWSLGASALGTGISAAFGGGQDNDPGKLHSRWQDPYQGQLFQSMMQQGLNGGGDFGYGSLVKQGTGQLNQMMADRGISSNSGVALGAQSNMINNAMSQDQGNRRNYMMGLMTANPNKETSGHGWDDAWSYNRYGEVPQGYTPSSYNI